MKSVEEKLAESVGRFIDFRVGLIGESDRGCVLYAAAYIETVLGELLCAGMVQDKELRKDLLTSNGPLSTFSSRIKMAYYLGKISESQRKDLNVIRGVRNEFAYHAEKLTFEDQSVGDRCKNLTHNWREDDVKPRTMFTATVTALLLHLENSKLVAIPTERCAEVRMPESVAADGNELARTISEDLDIPYNRPEPSAS